MHSTSSGLPPDDELEFLNRCDSLRTPDCSFEGHAEETWLLASAPPLPDASPSARNVLISFTPTQQPHRTDISINGHKTQGERAAVRQFSGRLSTNASDRDEANIPATSRSPPLAAIFPGSPQPRRQLFAGPVTCRGEKGPITRSKSFGEEVRISKTKPPILPSGAKAIKPPRQPTHLSSASGVCSAGGSTIVVLSLEPLHRTKSAAPRLLTTSTTASEPHAPIRPSPSHRSGAGELATSPPPLERPQSTTSLCSSRRTSVRRRSSSSARSLSGAGLSGDQAPSTAHADRHLASAGTSSASRGARGGAATARGAKPSPAQLRSDIVISGSPPTCARMPEESNLPSNSSLLGAIGPTSAGDVEVRILIGSPTSVHPSSSTRQHTVTADDAGQQSSEVDVEVSLLDALTQHHQQQGRCSDHSVPSDASTDIAQPSTEVHSTQLRMGDGDEASADTTTTATTTHLTTQDMQHAEPLAPEEGPTQAPQLPPANGHTRVQMRQNTQCTCSLM